MVPLYGHLPLIYFDANIYPFIIYSSNKNISKFSAKELHLVGKLVLFIKTANVIFIPTIILIT